MSVKLAVLRAVVLVLAYAATLCAGGGVVVDCAEPLGEFRPLHGVNGGPLDRGGLLDLTAYHHELKIPLTRLHDCHWPNPDVVDMHVVFPDFAADPAKPESYDFVRTDAYLKPIVAGGSRVVYRLGESIEHGPDKRRSRPPEDLDKWAAVCVGIIRHYNEGWAGGFRYDIRHWEIWNEPDNRPNCWTGSDDDYVRLYAAAAKAIKRRFPGVNVGGPAVGNVGRLEMHRDGVDLLRTGPEPLLMPSPFVEKFLAACKRDALPLDFFSWHTYGNDPQAVAAQAVGVRKMLDRAGFAKTESHLNEWNYLPDNDWGPVMLAGQGAGRRRFYERMGGAEGAAYVACVLAGLQDCPLDAANFFNADAGEFGLFERDGVPRKTYYAFKAFRQLLETPVRVGAKWDGAGHAAAAGVSRGHDAASVLLGRFDGPDEPVDLSVRNLPWRGPTDFEVLVIDAEKNLEVRRAGRVEGGDVRIVEPLRAPAVALVRLRQGAAKAP